jgi:O-antigen/teichoic acid export membrane protein
MLVAATAWLAFDPPRAIRLCLVAAAALTEISQDPCVWMLRAYERQDAEALLLMVSQVGWLAGLGVGAALKLSVTFMIGVATVAFLVRLAVGALIALRMVYRPVFRPDWSRIKGLILQGLPFGVAMFGVVLYGRVGVLLLKALSTSADVAYFNVAYMLSQPLGFISTALSMSAFPILARYAHQSPAALRAALRKTSKYQLLVTLPAMVGLFLLSERVIPLLFHGADFGKAGTALKVMSLGLTFIFLNLMARYVLMALDRQRVYLKAIAAGLVVNAVLSVLLIPHFGFIGACAAYLGAEVAILIVCQLTLSQYVSVADLAREGARPLLAAVGMGLVIASLSSANLFVVVAAGGVAYVALLLVLKVLSPQEFSILRGVYVSFRLPGSAYLSRAGNR